MSKEKKNEEKTKRRYLTPEEQELAHAQYEDRISMPITNVRLLSDEEVEELRRQGLID